jgi:hypothetical protein
MFDAIKPLLDSGIINEETRNAINEAWETKLVEAREQVRAELREEFAGRYEHDKKVMVEALDKMVTESLTAELSEFASEKQAVVEDRVKFRSHMMESAGRFNEFLVKKLAEEIQELRKDRKIQAENVQRLEQFVIKALSEEIKEFSADKQAVVETKVRLVANAKEKIAELQQKFIKRSAALVQETVTSNLKSELTQLKEDVQLARENMFGRRIFEAFASEFGVTHLNENKEIRKLQAKVSEQVSIIESARKIVKQKDQIVESKDRELRIIKESTDRKEKLAEMLTTLNKEKSSVMSQLLENVQTDKLQSAFEKYLPAVLNNSVVKKSEKAVLSESRVEITGDKSAKATAKADDTNVIELKRLAGL